MINRIKAFLANSGAAGSAPEERSDALQLAAAALLIEAARLDSGIKPVEHAVVARLVRERFGLSAEEASSLLEAAEGAVERSNQLFGFTQVVNDRFAYEERVGMIEMLWEVCYADGRLHDFEANLLRRIAGLLHVSDADSGAARKRVLARLEAGRPGRAAGGRHRA